MIIKHHNTPRLIITVLTLALTSTVLMTGCRKNDREKIDLSSIHTTAAPETTAPKAASTEDPAAAPETSASLKDSSSPGASSSVKNISTKTNTYTSGKVSIEYPSVIHLDDRAKTAAIDTLLKDNALSILDQYDLDDSQDTLTIKCKVLSADRSQITATYTGTCQTKGGAFPVHIFYSNTVDVGKADNVGFSKFADPYTMAGYVLSNDCEFYNVTPELSTELMKYKNDTTIEAYTNMFSHADFPVRGTFPESFSYEHEGSIFFSIPAPHALGDYAIIKFTPDNK